MSIILRQTNVAAGCGAVAGCAPDALALAPQSLEATAGGTAGVSELTVTVAAGSIASAVMFQSASGEPGSRNWSAGDWVLRMRVTTANSRLRLASAHICRFSAACGSLGTVGSLTGQNISLGTIGVKTMTVSGVPQAAGASDVAYIVLGIKNFDGAVNRSFGFVPDQEIDTPLTTGVAVRRRRMESY